MNAPPKLPRGRPKKRRSPPDPKKPETWYLRSEVGTILGIHKSTIAGFDGRYLHPVVVDGFHRYHPIEVSALKERRRKKKGDMPGGPTRGDIAAAVFKMLDDGSTRREIVVALQITPEEAQDYWEAWSEDFESARIRKLQREQQAKLEKLEAEERATSEKRRNDRMARIKAMVEADAHAAGLETK